MNSISISKSNLGRATFIIKTYKVRMPTQAYLHVQTDNIPGKQFVKHFKQGVFTLTNKCVMPKQLKRSVNDILIVYVMK